MARPRCARAALGSEPVHTAIKRLNDCYFGFLAAHRVVGEIEQQDATATQRADATTERERVRRETFDALDTLRRLVNGEMAQPQ